MTGFIEITDKNNRLRLLNVKHIEEIAEYETNNCIIYFAFSCPDAVEQDYYVVRESYQSIKNKIKMATMR